MAARISMSINALHERDPLFVQPWDGSVGNDDRIKPANYGFRPIDDKVRWTSVSLRPG